MSYQGSIRVTNSLDEFPCLILKPEEMNYSHRHLHEDRPTWDITEGRGKKHRWNSILGELYERATDAPVDVSVVTNNIHNLYCHMIEWAVQSFLAVKWLFPNAIVREVINGADKNIGDWEKWQGGDSRSKVLRLLFPDAELKFGSHHRPSCDKILFYDAMCAKTHFSKSFPAFYQFPQTWFEELRERAYKSLGIQAGAAADPSKILYSKRVVAHHQYREAGKEIGYAHFRSRHFLPEAENAFVKVLKEFGDVTEVDFQYLTFEEQVKITSQHGVIAGIHGNNLTNLIFLPSGGRCLEVFPRTSFNFFYQAFCEVFGVHWCGFNEDKVFSMGYRSMSDNQLNSVNYVVEKINETSLRYVMRGFKGLWMQ